MSAVTAPHASRSRMIPGIVVLVAAVVVFIALQAVPAPGALLLPFSQFQVGKPLGAVTVVLVGLLIAFALLLISSSRARGGAGALIALLGWIGGLAVHEQLLLRGVDVNAAPTEVVFASSVALLLSIAWLIALRPRPRAWLSLLVLLLIPILVVPVEALIRVVAGGIPRPTDVTGEFALVELITTLRVVLLVFVPVALVVVGSLLLSRPRALSIPA